MPKVLLSRRKREGMSLLTQAGVERDIPLDPCTQTFLNYSMACNIFNIKTYFFFRSLFLRTAILEVLENPK